MVLLNGSLYYYKNRDEISSKLNERQERKNKERKNSEEIDERRKATRNDLYSRGIDFLSGLSTKRNMIIVATLIFVVFVVISFNLIGSLSVVGHTVGEFGVDAGSKIASSGMGSAVKNFVLNKNVILITLAVLSMLLLNASLYFFKNRDEIGVKWKEWKSEREMIKAEEIERSEASHEEQKSKLSNLYSRSVDFFSQFSTTSNMIIIAVLIVAVFVVISFNLMGSFSVIGHAVGEISETTGSKIASSGMVSVVKNFVLNKNAILITLAVLSMLLLNGSLYYLKNRESLVVRRNKRLKLNQRREFLMQQAEVIKKKIYERKKVDRVDLYSNVYSSSVNFFSRLSTKRNMIIIAIFIVIIFVMVSFNLIGSFSGVGYVVSEVSEVTVDSIASSGTFSAVKNFVLNKSLS